MPVKTKSCGDRYKVQISHTEPAGPIKALSPHKTRQLHHGEGQRQLPDARVLRSLHVRNLSQVGVLHCQIGKKACTLLESEIEAQRTFQRKLKPRLLLNAFGDAFAIVVRVEKHYRPDQKTRQKECKAYD